MYACLFIAIQAVKNGWAGYTFSNMMDNFDKKSRLNYF